MKEYIVETRSLKKYYQMGENTVKALDGVDFRVKDQEFVAIIGKSGSGKSTLLHMLGGLDVPTDGEVLVEGKCLLGMKKEQLAIFRRRKIGFIFQNYNLVPDLNVYENVILPAELDGRKVDAEYVDGILELLGLSEKREALPGTLSGGQQQRAAIARALAAKPAIILADEPTGNLDSVTSHDVLGLLKMAAKQFSQTLILITHDRDIAQLADRIVHIVAIIGKSGSGKSTLLHMLGGLDVPTDGEVLVEGKCLLGMKKEQLAIFRRRKIGFIFQNYNLVPDLNVYENVILPAELDGRKVDAEYVDGILELLGLSEKREALPGTLSGGQQQRAAIARALAAKPAIILADEPTGNLDSVTSHDVLGLLKMAAKQFSQTLILITHDRDIAQLADRIVHIEDGKIVGDTGKGSDSYA